MTRTILAAAAMAMFVSSRAGAQSDADAQFDARITAVEGHAAVLTADDGAEYPAEVGMALAQGDRVVTGAESKAEIALDGESLITLDENSDFQIQRMERKQSIFTLALGSFLANVKKLTTQSMTVRTPTAVAAVRGTEFGIEIGGDGQSHIGVFNEGRLEVHGREGGVQFLNPQQETSVLQGQSPMAPTPLSRFLARRAQMDAHRARFMAVRRDWKPMNIRERQAARVQVRAAPMNTGDHFRGRGGQIPRLRQEIIRRAQERRNNAAPRRNNILRKKRDERRVPEKKKP